MLKLKHWYKKVLRPRLIYIPFLLTWLILLPLTVLPTSRKRSIKLGIEAGNKGWESIEFKELHQSAIEYLGSDCVAQIVVDKQKSYLGQLFRTVREVRPTHYLYDPRTAAQNWIVALLQSFVVSSIFRAYNVIPVVLLTDCAERIWRTQAAIVTAHQGVVITFISVKEIAPIFPHFRIVGPSLMPFSQATLRMLNEIKRSSKNPNMRSAIFVGSLYEPRTSTLQAIDSGLKPAGFGLEIKGRLPGMPRIPDSMYWETMVQAAIGFTTADQVESEKSDWSWIPHMVYRYLEVTAAGSLLIAPDVPGLRRYFSSGEHFVKFETVDEAIELIRYYLENPSELEAVAAKGHARASALINARVFWTSINAALGKHALI